MFLWLNHVKSHFSHAAIDFWHPPSLVTPWGDGGWISQCEKVGRNHIPAERYDYFQLLQVFIPLGIFPKKTSLTTSHQRWKRFPKTLSLNSGKHVNTIPYPFNPFLVFKTNTPKLKLGWWGRAYLILFSTSWIPCDICIHTYHIYIHIYHTCIYMYIYMYQCVDMYIYI